MTILPRRHVPLNFDTHRLVVLFTGVVEGYKCDVTSPSGLIECFRILGKERRFTDFTYGPGAVALSTDGKERQKECPPVTTITIDRIKIPRVIL